MHTIKIKIDTQNTDRTNNLLIDYVCNINNIFQYTKNNATQLLTIIF